MKSPIQPIRLLSLFLTLAFTLISCKSTEINSIKFTNWEYKTTEKSNFKPLSTNDFNHLEKYVEN